MTRRAMQVGDVIKVTTMPSTSFTLRRPLYALALERRDDQDQDYHELLIVEGGYDVRGGLNGRMAGETFNLPGKPDGKHDLDWHIVPPQSVPDRIWAAIAKWRLIGGDSDA